MADVYGVFEGGGVKGIALVGALARVEQEPGLKFVGFAGTSAGAIVASLAAVGYRASDEQARNLYDPAGDGPLPDMKTVMMSIDYETFLDGAQTISLKDLSDLDATLRPKFSEMLDRLQALREHFGQIRWWRPDRIAVLFKQIARFRKDFEMQLGAVEKGTEIFQIIREQKGLYRTTTFAKWLSDILRTSPAGDGGGAVTFGGLRGRGRLLKIVTASLRDRLARVYGPGSYPDMAVVDAVRHSMSIPFFFCPCQETDNYLVDGGIVSNFPAWVFDRERKQQPGVVDPPAILGFRLIPDPDSSAPELTQRDPPFGKFGAYASAVFNTLLEGAQEVQSDAVHGLGIIPIKIPMEITAYRFDLNPSEREELFRLGYTTAHSKLLDKDFRNAIGI
jgi:NTE family protein